jgi:polysaccharide export outer membrane protein
MLTRPPLRPSVRWAAVALFAWSGLASSSAAFAAKRELPPNVEVLQGSGQAARPFTFGPGDRMVVKVYKHPDLDCELQVAPDGSVTLPLIGRVVVGGENFETIVAKVQAGLSEYYTDAQVSVNVVTVANQKVFVVGEVLLPTVLQITGEMRTLEALARTGGINANARTKNLLLIRQNEGAAPSLYTFDVDRLLTGDSSQNISLQADDVLVVPPRTIVNIERFFRHIQTLLGPVVNISQVYRNVNPTSGAVIEDAPTGGN